MGGKSLTPLPTQSIAGYFGGWAIYKRRKFVDPHQHEQRHGTARQALLCRCVEIQKWRDTKLWQTFTMLWRRQSTCCRFMLHFKTTSSYNWLLSATKMRSNKNQQNCRSTLSPVTGDKLLPGWFFGKISHSFQRNETVVFLLLCHWITWASVSSDGFIISTSGFRYRSIQWTFVSRKKRILPPQTWMAIKHTHNVDKM